MNRVLLVVLAAVSISCADLCSDQVISSATSADGHMTAILNERDCGATTNFARSVQLVATDRANWAERFSLLISDTPVRVEGQQLVKVAWTGERELTVSASSRVPDADVFRLNEKIGSVRIVLAVP